MKCKCPLCGGTGEIERVDFESEKKRTRDLERVLAQKIRMEGYTIRKIGEILGYKHPGSISHLLKEITI